MIRKAWWLVVPLVCGCQTKTLPNPNAAGQGASADALTQNLRLASEEANRRVANGEIDESTAKELVVRKARELADAIVLDKTPEVDAWKVGDLYRSAQMWKEAEAALSIAIKSPANEDRRIVDTLRLAQALAHQGKAKEAIAISERVFDAKPTDSAPILPGILYEVIPPIEGRGNDKALAGLLEKAIAAHMATIVDHRSDAGKAFLLARKHHVSMAWEKVVFLYDAARLPNEASRARDARNQFARSATSA